VAATARCSPVGEVVPEPGGLFRFHFNYSMPMPERSAEEGVCRSMWFAYTTENPAEIKLVYFK
jgi:hypothetical protein